MSAIMNVINQGMLPADRREIMIDAARAELASLRAAAAERDRLQAVVDAHAEQLEQARNAINRFMNRLDTLPWVNTIDGNWVSLNSNVWREWNYNDCEQLQLAANAPAPVEERTAS